MGATPLGFQYADDSDPVDVPTSTRELAESVNEYLTPVSATITPGSGYGGELRFLRFGPTVIMTGGVTFSGTPSTTDFVTIGTITGGFAPLAPVPSPGWVLYNTGTADVPHLSYQILVQTDGTIRFRHTRAIGSTMSVALAWLTGGV